MSKNTRWIRLGECNQCGDCCKSETVEARIEKYKEMGLEFDYHPCDKQDPETGLCTIYGNRPKHCRDFPVDPIDLACLPRCGYYFIEVPFTTYLKQKNGGD